MTEAELRKKINSNQQEYSKAKDSAKALLMAENEALAKELDTLTGGKSVYDTATGKWNLSETNAIDKYINQRDKVAGSVYEGYDPTTDPAYSALKKEYLREADRGTEDTMGVYSGLTGGLPSTAAVSAAQQAGNYHRAQLADRQVELGAQDYNRYAAGLEADRAMLNIYEQEAAQSAQSLAALGDFSAMGKLYGWTPEQIREAEKQWLEEQSGGYSGGGGGGYGGSDKKVSDVPITKREDRFPRPEDKDPMKKKETKYNNRTEDQIYSMVKQLVIRYKDPERVSKIINDGSMFTKSQMQVANTMLDELISGGAF